MKFEKCRFYLIMKLCTFPVILFFDFCWWCLKIFFEITISKLLWWGGEKKCIFGIVYCAVVNNCRRPLAIPIKDIKIIVLMCMNVCARECNRVEEAKRTGKVLIHHNSGFYVLLSSSQSPHIFFAQNYYSYRWRLSLPDNTRILCYM